VALVADPRWKQINQTLKGVNQ